MDSSGMPSISPSPGGVRVDRIVTSGTFELDGGSWQVDNNVWVVGDDKECVIIDAAHDGRTIVKSIALQRRVTAVICTHAHNDHINAVGEVCDGTRAPAYRPYLPVRRPIHGRIIEQCVAAAGPARDAAGETTALSVFFTIGCPGAGKTSVLRGLVDRYRTSNSGPTVPGPARGLRRVLRILSGWLRNIC